MSFLAEKNSLNDFFVYSPIAYRDFFLLTPGRSSESLKPEQTVNNSLPQASKRDPVWIVLFKN
jgi:hypothetical protein